MMWPIKKKIDGFQVNSYNFTGWLTTKQLMEMYPTPEERGYLFLTYEPKEEPMVILSLAVLFVAGCIAFGIFGAILWEIHMLGLI